MNPISFIIRKGRETWKSHRPTLFKSAKDLNISAAAGKLYITQQALSKVSKTHGRQAGRSVFVEVPNGVALTPYT